MDQDVSRSLRATRLLQNVKRFLQNRDLRHYTIARIKLQQLTRNDPGNWPQMLLAPMNLVVLR